MKAWCLGVTCAHAVNELGTFMVEVTFSWISRHPPDQIHS